MGTWSEVERSEFRHRIHDYEKTDVWAARSRRFRDTRKLKRCAACLKPGIEDVHHITYDRAFHGREPDADLVGLCHRCHMSVHQLTPSYGGSMTLRDATEFVLAHTARWDVVAPGKRQPRQPAGRQPIPSDRSYGFPANSGWRYVAPPKRVSTYVPPDPLPARWVPRRRRRRSWLRRNAVPLLLLAVLLAVGVVATVMGQHPL